MREVRNGGPETEDCAWVRGYEDIWEEAKAGELGVEEDEKDDTPVDNGSNNQCGGIGAAKIAES